MEPLKEKLHWKSSMKQKEEGSEYVVKIHDDRPRIMWKVVVDEELIQERDRFAKVSTFLTKSGPIDQFRIDIQSKWMRIDFWSSKKFENKLKKVSMNMSLTVAWKRQIKQNK